MSNPKRIQRKRIKGWKMPEGAVYVGRPSRWGNPFRVVLGLTEEHGWADGDTETRLVGPWRAESGDTHGVAVPDSGGEQ